MMTVGGLPKYRVWRTLHLCIDIKGCLANRDFDWFCDDYGNRLYTDEEIEANLKQYLADGIQKLPVGDCDKFDPKTGCQGHPHYEKR